MSTFFQKNAFTFFAFLMSRCQDALMRSQTNQFIVNDEVFSATVAAVREEDNNNYMLPIVIQNQ